MKSKPLFVTRTLAVLLVAGGFTLASVPVFSQPGNDGAHSNGDAASRPEQMHQHLEKRLDKMAERLNITSAQQAAWSRYRSAVEAQFSAPPARPSTDADAATIVRWRADRASEMARKLAVVADATATLQSALDDKQRQTLRDMVRHEGRFEGHHHDKGEAKPTSLPTSF
jgi:hypothetical protein